jgi:hypothetical protein
MDDLNTSILGLNMAKQYAYSIDFANPRICCQASGPYYLGALSETWEMLNTMIEAVIGPGDGQTTCI